MRATVVEQLGFAIMPRCVSRSSPLISGTTNGTSGAIRKAELLSMTTQPCLLATSANWRELCDPALKIAMSKPLKASGVVSRTVSRLPHAFISRPADLDDASRRASATGNSLCSSRRIISCPTAPVAPRIPMRYFFNGFRFFVFRVCGSDWFLGFELGRSCLDSFRKAPND